MCYLSLEKFEFREYLVDPHAWPWFLAPIFPSNVPSDRHVFGMTTSSTIPDPIHLIIDCLIGNILDYYPSELSLNKIRMMIILKMTHCSKEWLWCRVEEANPDDLEVNNSLTLRSVQCPFVTVKVRAIVRFWWTILNLELCSGGVSRYEWSMLLG